MIVQISEKKQPAQFKNGSTFEDLECTNMEAAKIINRFLDHCNLVTLYLRTNPLVCSQVSADKRLATIFALLLAEIGNSQHVIAQCAMWISWASSLIMGVLFWSSVRWANIHSYWYNALMTLSPLSLLHYTGCLSHQEHWLGQSILAIKLPESPVLLKGIIERKEKEKERWSFGDHRDWSVFSLNHLIHCSPNNR